ncbi:hypothetical protein AAU57_08675 [Nonlabens sp. YIK11]|uniref:hypothetical protein n=1 Tax=Nonlabens sp. YIK11 TaxID=1453349 RepID=UPI0006DD26A3|nr:hypothetical protein [Nonlabens sp. YIK11]KQC33377.1 hypothetical protein AAU57_08675 [Nonlabens sp. YIK11]
METLRERAQYHFDNLDLIKFKEDWAEIIASSCSDGLKIDDLIEHQKRYLYFSFEKPPEKQSFSFNISQANPSFSSDSLFLQNEQRRSI